MNILIKQATLIDKRHPDNGALRDLLIEDGTITQMASHLKADADVVVAEDGLCVSVGWMDMRANFRDPGHEHKENLQSGMKAAAAGGFTAVGLSPETMPAVDNKSAIAYLLGHCQQGQVELVPVGAASKALKGETLAEMYDMYLAGAKAFGDGKRSIQTAGLLQRALLYSKNFGVPILHFPYDESLHPGGQMHEGIASTHLGMKGIPSIAETLVVQRDLQLLGYTEGRLHLGPLSTAEAVAMVHEGRSNGLKITCETTAAHLAYTDESIQNFDSQYKVLPPLRDEANRQALLTALKLGQIQAISSDHSPEDEEHKKLEFDFAAFGTAGIESFFCLLMKAVGTSMPLHDLIATFSLHPRQILGMELPEINLGTAANLTLFNPTGSTTFAENEVRSRAYNFAEKELTLPGKVVGTVFRGSWQPRDWAT